MATFGKTTDGTTGSPSTSTITKVSVSPAVPATSGTVVTGHAQLAFSGAKNVRFAIYADASGTPGTLLALSDVVSLDGAMAWRTFTFPAGQQITVTAGTSYYIGPAWEAGTTITYQRDSDTGLRREGTGFTWPTPTSPTWAAAQVGPMAAYVTYTESGGGGGTTPVVRSAASDGVDDTTTASVAKPTGLAVGDYLLAFQESDADGDLVSMTAPSGFVQLGSQAPTAGTNIPAGKVWGKVADSTDVAASTFAFPDSTGAHCSVVLLAIQAGTYDPTTPVSGLAWATQGSAANANITAPSTSGVLSGLLLGGFMAELGGVVRSFSTAPSGMTLTHQAATGSATYVRTAVYQQSLSSAGATGTKTAVLSGTPDGWAATALVVNPAPVAGGVAQRTGGFLSLLG